MHCGANLSAFRTPSHLAAGCGARQRRIAHGWSRERDASVDGESIFLCALQHSLLNLRSGACFQTNQWRSRDGHCQQTGLILDFLSYSLPEGGSAELADGILRPHTFTLRQGKLLHRIRINADAEWRRVDCIGNSPQRVFLDRNLRRLSNRDDGL